MTATAVSETSKTHYAEFHDIGKIVDWDALGLRRRKTNGDLEDDPHEFEECVDPSWGANFDAPVWRSIHRKCKGVSLQIREKHFPQSTDWFLVSIADELAAGMGRLRESKITGKPAYGYHCLWTGNTEPDRRIKTRDALLELILYLNSAPSWRDTITRYLSELHARPETARPGLNVTSLAAHSALTGKIARVLEPFAADAAGIFDYDRMRQKIGERRLFAVSIYIDFRQQPFRTSDFSIFAARRAAISAALARYPDNVLVQYANHITAVFLTQKEEDGFVDHFCDLGFEVEFREAVQQHQRLVRKSNGVQEALEEGRKCRVLKELPDSIEPPLCENCQMARGVRRWPADYLAQRSDLSESARALLRTIEWTGLRAADFEDYDRQRLGEWLEQWSQEELCEQCFGLRSSAPSLGHLAQWDTGKIAWARISLDLDILKQALRHLHAEYIRSQHIESPDLDLDQLPVRLPLIADFVNDYERFLATWSEQVTLSFGLDQVEQVDEGFVCVKLPQAKAALRLLHLFYANVTDGFPNLLNTSVSPIRLALSVAPPKHPFWVTWRFLRSSKSDVAVQIVGAGSAEVPLTRLSEVLQVIGRGDRRSLHRLREIACTSRSLADLVLHDRTTRDYTLKSLQRILPLGMDFEGLMTIANLAEG